MKLAAYPKCYDQDIGPGGKMSVFDWIQMASTHLDVAGLEMNDAFFDSFDPGYVQRIRMAAEDAGFVIPMLICSPDFANPDESARRAAVAHEAHMIEVAALLGGEGTVCRVLSGPRHPSVGREQGVDWVVGAIDELIPLARERGIVLALENHYKVAQWLYPEFALKMDVFLDIVDAIPMCEHFGVQYDPSNAIVAGDDPLVLLERVKHRVVSMHASDRHLRPGATLDDLRGSDGTIGYSAYLSHGVIGEGMNDYDAIFHILSGVGFHGWVSIEDGMNGIEEIQASARFLREVGARHFPPEV